MEKLIKEEKWEHRGRSFVNSLFTDDKGYTLICFDAVTGKRIDTGKCSFDVRGEFLAKGRIDPVKEVEVMIRKSVTMWVDRGLI